MVGRNALCMKAASHQCLSRSRRQLTQQLGITGVASASASTRLTQTVAGRWRDIWLTR